MKSVLIKSYRPFLRPLRVQSHVKCTTSPKGSEVPGRELVIDNVTYETDAWTNITPKILSYIGRNLHTEKYHPIGLLKRRIVDFVYGRFRNARGNPLFSVHDTLSPVVTIRQNFDSLLIPRDHPSRRPSDSYYVNQRYVLRAHTSAHQWDLMRSGLDNFLVVGDVYRRDEIDTSHFPVFHQVEGVRLCGRYEMAERGNRTGDVPIFEDGSRTSKKQAVHTVQAVNLMEREMKETIEDMSRSLFGPETKGRWIEAYFPFTHPSWEYEILHEGKWMEVLGCGVMEHELLQSAGAVDKIGWAVGFGLERLAMKLYAIPDIRLFWSRDDGFLSQFRVDDVNADITFKPISIYPQCINDMSFWIPERFVGSDFLDLVRSVGSDVVESVTLIDDFTHPKTQRRSHCYRIVYRHMERTLTQAEVNSIHGQIEEAATKQLNVHIR